jgi:hypothetical protein
MPAEDTHGMKKSVDYSLDDHPADDPERPPASWSVAAADDCDECDDVRIELTLEEAGRAGAGVVAHLSPDNARRLRAALASALKELGEAP